MDTGRQAVNYLKCQDPEFLLTELVDTVHGQLHIHYDYLTQEEKVSTIYVYTPAYFERAEKNGEMLLKSVSWDCVLFPVPGKIPNIMDIFWQQKSRRDYIVMTDAEETPERMQNIIKKYIPDGQKAKAIVM